MGRETRVEACQFVEHTSMTLREALLIGLFRVGGWRLVEALAWPVTSEVAELERRCSPDLTTAGALVFGAAWIA
jgi:hypothetical protein